MPAALQPNKFMQSVYPAFPDDDTSKEVLFLKYSLGAVEYEKHVLFIWYNSLEDPATPITQIVQLTGNPGGYAFYHPLAKPQDQTFIDQHHSWSLGMLTRSQRDLLAQLAEQIPFDMKGRVNNCQVWSTHLLDYAWRDRIITKDVYNKIISEAALKPET